MKNFQTEVTYTKYSGNFKKKNRVWYFGRLSVGGKIEHGQTDVNKETT